MVPKVIEKIGWHTALTKGSKLGDIGCGTGEFLIRLSKAHPESQYVGFEISNEALLAFQEKLDNNVKTGHKANIRLHNLSEGDASVEHGTFDFLTCIDVLHDLTDPVTFLTTAKSYLKPDGKMLTLDPSAKKTPKENLETSGYP